MRRELPEVFTVGRIVKGIVLLIGIATFAWGGALITLGFVGASAAARNVHSRRTGGERDDAVPGRYTYSIAYEFVTRDGCTISGHSQAIGSSYTVHTPRRILYLEAAPWVNAPEDHCGMAVYPLVLVGVGVLMFWSVARGRPKSRTPAAPARARREKAATSEPGALSADAGAARAWLRRYRINSRRYAWGFFAVVVIGIGTLIRIELGEFDRDWYLATSFAAGVTWILAMWSRRVAESAWDGIVSSREVREVRDSRDSDAGSVRVRHIIHVQTDRGKHRKVRVGEDLFDAYPEGARVRKIAGLSFPLSDAADADTAFCPVCGNLLRGARAKCPGCRAPIFDFNNLD